MRRPSELVWIVHDCGFKAEPLERHFRGCSKGKPVRLIGRTRAREGTKSKLTFDGQ
jgi:hypothetical protein